MENAMEKRLELKAPVSRVWRALTDYRQFGEWFQVKIDGPFVPGERSTGSLTFPGYENVKWEATIQKIEPETLFSYTWHPHAVDEGMDYSAEEPTLVEFHLEPTATGTLLVVKESGFANLPAHRQLEAYRKNDGGWTQQLAAIERYVTATRTAA